jgi:S-adenosylmethionine:tRNA ribosyltransferase-isomerase
MTGAVDLLEEWAGKTIPQASLPPELRGRGREDVRLLVSDRASGRYFASHFHQLPEWLRRGDLLVLNRSQTVPASILARRGRDGTLMRLHVARIGTDGGDASHGSPRLVVEPRSPDGRMPRDEGVDEGERLRVPLRDHELVLTMGPRYHPRLRLWVVAGRPAARLWQALPHSGDPVRYAYVPIDLPLSYYQTTVGVVPGSAEMPSAARPLTIRMLGMLRRRGVGLAWVTLHTGLSSHEVDGPFDAFPILPEPYHVPRETVAQIRETRVRGGRVIAVGTTVVRALASAVRSDGTPCARRGVATVVVGPGRLPPCVDGLLTGLHAPRSSHLALLEAFLAPAWLKRAYATVLEEGWLWHEFGDLHLIVPDATPGHRGR